MNTLKCPKCGFSLEPGECAKPICPDCNEALHIFSENAEMNRDELKEVLMDLLRYTQCGCLGCSTNDAENRKTVNAFLYELNEKFPDVNPFKDNPYNGGEPLPILPIVATDPMEIKVKK